MSKEAMLPEAPVTHTLQHASITFVASQVKMYSQHPTTINHGLGI
jgi:hypothetical protein